MRRATPPTPAVSVGVACLGAVIRGETDHYDFVCAEAARGIMRVQLDTGVPCAFGVLTCATMEQALARAGGDKRDQGRHAAEAVLRMAALRERALGLDLKRLNCSRNGQGMPQLRQGPGVRQQPQPLDGRHQAPLRAEPAEGRILVGKAPRRVYVCTRCLKAGKVVKAL